MTVEKHTKNEACMPRLEKHNKPMMACGHVQNSTQDGKPFCCICIETEISETPDLSGRIARCPDCGNEEISGMNLPFFDHSPKAEKDRYYCGCKGWG